MYKENVLFQKHPGWPHILSYLTLGDLEAFGQSHWELQALLNAYLEKPVKIIVDQETLWRYPLDLNRDMYHKYQKTTMIEFNVTFYNYMNKDRIHLMTSDFPFE